MSKVLYVRCRSTEDQRESQQESTYDGVRCRLEVQYNAVAGIFFLSLRDLSRELLVGSLAMVPGVDLLRPFKHLDVWPGSLFLEGPSGSPATLETLDVSVFLKYRTVT